LNIFNKFFINRGKKLAEKANYVSKNEAVNASTNISFDNSFSKKIVNYEIINFVKNFKMKNLLVMIGLLPSY
jgi:hypothetical protein